MTVTRDAVRMVLASFEVPGGGTLISRDLVRALSVDEGLVKFVLEAPTPAEAQALAKLEAQIVAVVRGVAGVTGVQMIVTAHGPSAAPAKPAAPAPSLKIGGHPTPQQGGPQKLSGINRILAVGSGKGGVGKSTVSSNLAVALAKEGRRVGLLDADIYGPSQAKMFGVSKRPATTEGNMIEPLVAHGVTMMSMGLLMKEGEAVVWRGPMLMGAIQQLLTQVLWGELDVLIIDLPPGTGDVQLSLAQRAQLTGALVVSTPQDVALLDALKAIDMFGKLKTPILGLIENMSSYHCPNCGHEEHIFGHGGVALEAERLGLPFLGALPLSLDVRVAGDAGAPIALGESAAAGAYRALARRLIEGGVA